MALLSWSKQYLIGNELIDAEHEELFKLVNAFHTHWAEAHTRQDIAKILNQLIVYAEMHFRHEEKIMGEAGFPKLEGHQKIHEAMIDSIFRLQQSYEDGNFHLEMDTMKFVKAWLVEHILENDYLFRDFLARKNNADGASDR